MSAGLDARDLARLSLAALLVLPLLLPLLDAWWLSRRAARCGAPLRMRDIVSMRLRRINPAAIIRARSAAAAAGVDLAYDALQAQARAGGQVERTVQALCAARAAGIPLSFARACAIERAGFDAVLALAAATTPRAIPFGDALPAGAGAITATSCDGVRLSAGGTATVRLCLERLVEGTGEEELRARLGAAIAAAIAAADAHALTASPAALSAAVRAAGVDAGSAFELDALAITLRRIGMEQDPPAAPAAPP